MMAAGGTGNRAMGWMMLAGLLGLAPCSAAAEEADDHFGLYVQTHFSQGWNLKALEVFPSIGATGFRDGMYWRKVEEVPGVYDVSQFSRYLEAARDAGMEVLVVFAGTHPSYDGGDTPYSEEGLKAYARYVAAVVDAYPDVINRIELGNEYNTNGFLVGRWEDDPGRYFGPLAREVSKAVKAKHPDTQIWCTGAHSVATGYLRKVFESGALEYCDAISFHPYRDAPANLDKEIARLRALMREFGGEIPLQATEFGDWFKDVDDAPDFLLKMVSLMASSGVENAYWYALREQEWWPNMGLFTEEYTEQPAAVAFGFLQKELLPLGRPAARGTLGEDQLYEFGDGGRAFVAWGAPGDLNVEGEAGYFDSLGNSIDPVRRLSDKVVVIRGEGLKVSITRDRPVFSSVLGFGEAPWSYLARREDGRETPFQNMDWNWNPYIGHPNFKPMLITFNKIASAVFNGRHVHAVERFTAPDSGEYVIEGRWYREKAHEDGAEIRISRNGDALAGGVVADTPFEWGPETLMLKAGDVIDFSVGPNRGEGGNWVERAITVTGPPQG
jgi:hypothetical protein